MIVTFKNGISVSKLPKLNNVIKECGGTAIIVSQENAEAQNTVITVPCSAYSDLYGKICAVTGSTCMSRCKISTERK